MAKTIIHHEARRAFDAAINEAKDADTRAVIELAREYFTNPAFRAALEEFSFAHS